MGLEPGDIEKVPKELSVNDCYKRIYEWQKKYGKGIMKKKYGEEKIHYSDLLDALPSPNKATNGDMNYVFSIVIAGVMEWSFHRKDEHEIKMAAYAQCAIRKQYPDDGKEYEKSIRSSKLFNKFGYSGYNKNI